MSILYSHRYYVLTKTSNISIQADIIEVIFSSFHFTRVTLAVIFQSEHLSLPELGAVIEVKLGVEAHNLKNETNTFFLPFHTTHLTASCFIEIRRALKQETTLDDGLFH